MHERELETRAADIFIDAAAYIRTFGWQKSGMGTHGRPRCSMGALASAHPAKAWDKNLSAFVYERLYEQLDGLTLTEFNYLYDDGEEVAALFERTAQSILRPANEYANGLRIHEIA